MAAPWLAQRFATPFAGVLAPVAVWALSLLGESETVAVALPAALVAYLVAIRFPRGAATTVFAAFIVLLVGAPVLYPILFDVLAPMADTVGKVFMVRAEIWDATARFAQEAPVFGHGMQATSMAGPMDIARKYYPFDEVPHPHNGFLQLWTDIGGIGAAAMALLLAGLGLAVRSVAADRVPHILAATVVAGLAFATTYNLWAAWWLGLLGITAAYAIATSTGSAAE
jgi:O-antigen ligase